MSPATNWVKVDTPTITPDDDKVDFVFAPILGHDGGTVDATAVAAWGAVGRATTIPADLLRLRVQELGGDARRQRLPERAATTSTSTTRDPTQQLRGEALRPDLPGGFGWLDQTRTTCDVDVTADGWVGDKTGNGMPNDCEPPTGKDDLPLAGRRGAHPASTTTPRQRLQRQVPHRRLRRLHGARLPLPRTTTWPKPKAAHGTQRPKGGTTYICGEFTAVVTTTGEIGGGTDFGATAVEMIG